MRRPLLKIIALVVLTMVYVTQVQPQNAQSASATLPPRPAATADITRLLETYLGNVSDLAGNERFWAEDVVYIGSHGEQLGKKEILESVRSSSAAKSEHRRYTHKAEAIRVHQYGDVAVIPFKLIARIEGDGKVKILHHLVIAVFVKRAGMWQVVSWQVTDES